MNKKLNPLNVSQESANQFQMEQAVEQIKRNMSSMLEYQRLMAKLTREKFKALVDEGFTEQQALEVCKGKIIQ